MKSWWGARIRGRRHEAILARSLGMSVHPRASFWGVNGRPEYVQTCEASLRRLASSKIDLTISIG